MIPFYDTHAHLDYPDFSQDLAQVVERALAAGITRMIAIGTDLESSLRSIRISEQFPCVNAVVGWHPTQALAAPADLRPALRELARHPKVVAVGETGLDCYRLPSQQPGGSEADDQRYLARQAEIFIQQLEVASELGLNCVIHQRSAFQDVVAHLERFAGRVRGVFHCFADDPAAVEKVLSLGSLVSFTGILTYKNAENVRAALAAAPLGRFMLETDCPFLAPVPHRGRTKRCEPAHVQDIAQVAAKVKGCSLEELSRATCSAAEDFFRLGTPS